MRVLARLAAVLAIVTMSGCQETGGIPSHGGSGPRAIEEVPMLRTDSGTYRRGAQVTVRFTNRTNATMSYNLCRSRLERRNDEGDWVVSRSNLADGCTAEDRTLRPGQSVTYIFRIGDTTRAGLHRVSADLAEIVARSKYVAVSNTFMVTRDD